MSEKDRAYSVAADEIGYRADDGRDPTRHNWVVWGRMPAWIINGVVIIAAGGQRTGIGYAESLGEAEKMARKYFAKGWRDIELVPLWKGERTNA